MRDAISRMGQRRVAFGAVVAVAVLALIAVGVLVAFGGGSDAKPVPPKTPTALSSSTPVHTATPSVTPTFSPTPIAHAGILDGLPMTDAEWAARRDLLPLAVMLDNTSNANPHSGLDRADLVYEAFVEGGITRLMAVFWRQEADKVEPVRSARTPFVVWANELGALYGHAGGATTDNEANAIGQIAEWGVPDLNAFSPVSNVAYYRDSERYGPYDLATSTEALRAAASELGFGGTPKVASWLFREPGNLAPAGEPAEGIEVDFEGHLYSWQYIQWKWDRASKRYLRFQFGGPELDAISGDQLAFATVVVMTAPSHVADENGHVLYDQFGSGPATVFTGGQAYAGTWKKDDRESRTRFYDAAGKEISFERGPIFIEVLSTQSTFAFVATADLLPPLPEYVAPPPAPPEQDEEPTATATSTSTAVPSPTMKPSPTTSPTPAGSVTPASSATASSSSTAAPSPIQSVTQTTVPTP